VQTNIIYGYFVKTLIEYYSKTGNTKYAAKKITEQLNAELSEICYFVNTTSVDNNYLKLDN
jgi:flavodoxin